MENFTLDQVNVPEEVCDALNSIVDEINDINKIIQPMRDKAKQIQAKAKAKADARKKEEIVEKARVDAEARVQRDAENKAAADAVAKVRAESKAKQILFRKPESIEAIQKAMNEAAAKKEASPKSIGQAIVKAKEKIWAEYKSQQVKEQEND